MKPAPRMMTRVQLRAYLGGVAWPLVLERMSAGKLPGPVWGLAAADAAARWDRRAVDRALDLASGIPGSIEQQVSELDRALGFR